METKNVVLVLDAQEIIKKIKAKYGNLPVFSEAGKQKRAAYEQKSGKRSE